MKKARFWAIFMTGLLVFSTLTNDCIVAGAVEPDGIEQDAPAPADLGGIEQDAPASVDIGGIEQDTPAPADLGGIEPDTPAPANLPLVGGADGYSLTLDYEDDEAGKGTGDGTELTTPAPGESEAPEGDGLPVDGAKAGEDDDEDVSYPAIDFGTFEAGDVSVTISAPEGAFPEGTTVSVQAVSGEQFRSKAEALADDDEVVVDIFAVDITFTYNGEPIEPKKPVSVSFSRLNLSGDDLTVVHEDEVLSDGDNTSSVDVTVPSFSPVYAFTTTARSASALSEEGAATANYTVNVYYQKQNRRYPEQPNETYTESYIVGQRIEYTKAKSNDEIDGITYVLDTQKSNLSIESPSADSTKNVINVFYKRTANKVYVSILHPGQTMPPDARPYDYLKFYPSSDNRYSWPATAMELPEGQWSVYNRKGITLSDYIITWPDKNAINTYLKDTYGSDVTFDDVIWYTYKCDEQNYWHKKGGAEPYTSNWYINGYVPEDAGLIDSITITASSKEKTYDGTPLTDNSVADVVCTSNKINTSDLTIELTMTEESTITNPGSVSNVIASAVIKDSTGAVIGSKDADGKVTGKFKNINFVPGTLMVNEYAGKITVTVYGGEWTYDGKEHAASVSISSAEPARSVSEQTSRRRKRIIENGEINSQSLPTGYSVTKVMTSSVQNVEYIESETVVARTKITVVNANGDDVTNNLNIEYVADGTSFLGAALKVNPAPINVTTYSNSKVYNGEVLTAGGKMEGVVEKDKKDVKLVITGRQLEVGRSRNTYRIEWGDASWNNYRVYDTLGWLIITDGSEPDNPTPDDPTPDDPTPDNPTPDNPTPDNPTPDNPTPDNPTPNNPTPDWTTLITTLFNLTPAQPTLIPAPDNPTPDEPALVPALVAEIPAEEVPVAGVLGASRGIEADHSSVLGQRREAAEAGVLGARRDAVTSDANQMAMYLMLMGVATGVGGAYVFGRRKKHED
ncbi:MAG: hypothetical protein J5509_02735 [Lachnospiraceae bacterium]|nr:hypothetical protein [Lachnospiraceae bacterium]